MALILYEHETHNTNDAHNAYNDNDNDNDNDDTNNDNHEFDIYIYIHIYIYIYIYISLMIIHREPPGGTARGADASSCRA